MGAVGARLSGGPVSAASQTVDQARAALICLINKKRARNHVKPVHEHPLLDSAAQVHTDAMTTENFFSHEGDGNPGLAAPQTPATRPALAPGASARICSGAPRVSARPARR